MTFVEDEKVIIRHKIIAQVIAQFRKTEDIKEYKDVAEEIFGDLNYDEKFMKSSKSKKPL